ncbi:MAG TPA: hypothetical protein VES95_11070 [Dermatophilaceae bacterium]|nr:hypothetical protein [Dermatophilaceae bacterium]
MSATEVERGTQRRTVATLSGSQVLGGVGLSAGVAVGALLAEEVSGSAQWAGLGGTFQVLGAALIAVPMVRLMAARGRRAGLVLGYVLAMAGALGLIASGVIGSFTLLLLSSLLFGGATASNSQARYAAVDLAAPAHRGRDLATVVWATTVGSVLGPNLVGPSEPLSRALGLPAWSDPSSSRWPGWCWPCCCCRCGCVRTLSWRRGAAPPPTPGTRCAWSTARCCGGCGSSRHREPPHWAW